MSPFATVVVIATAQVAFIVLTLRFLFVARRLRRQESLEKNAAEATLAEPLQATMFAGNSDAIEALALALGRLRPSIAVSQLVAIGSSRLSQEQLSALARRVRTEPWVDRAVADGYSAKWWKRMSSARLLAMVGNESDAALLSRLVADPHPAVASAATVAIGGRASAQLIDAVVRHLPTRSAAVRFQHGQALRSQAEEATPVLLQCLAGPHSAHELRAWIQLAETLETPAALSAVIPFTEHDDAEVRTSAARALRSCHMPGAAEAAIRLLADGDWRVRAAAARAAGTLNAAGAVPLLSDALRDQSWWVRYRAALALATLGDGGRLALQASRESSDRYAREMAILVSTLSDATLVELTVG